jgi:phosphoglycerol transferase MdoB-like AlkP superfamily enzyme
MSKLPRLAIFGLAIVVLHLLLLGAARLLYWGYFDNANNPMPLSELFHAIYLGGKFDLRLTLITLLPLLLLGGFRWFSPFRSQRHRWFWQGYLILAFAVIVLFYIFNFGYYAYLGKPMDATILRFADDLGISMGMLWETYPVVGIVALLLVLTGAYAFAIHRIMQRVSELPAWQPRNRKRKTVGVTLITFLVIFGIYGKFSYYPLRWSDAFATTHPFTSAVSLNPVLYFAQTLKNKKVTYSVEKTREYYDLMADYLGVQQPDKQALNFKREFPQPGPLAAKRPNIILVYLESFAAYKTTTFGNPLDPTPNFDALARNGLLFTRYYTPHTGTARSVFTGITGIPDIEMHRTSSRNPLVVDQHTLVNAFKDYNKYYFLGGSANWGNIRGILSHNIPGLDIHEEGSYESPRIDVWGISDLNLFEEANKVFKKQDKPFFAIIQTSGNHRPYTIPEDNRGFKLQHHSEAELKRDGFISNEEYNSFRFMDHSIGNFMRQARKEDYFDNTIFVFFGDHGITGYGGKHTPAYASHFLTTSFHVPLLIYAPKLIKPRRIDKVATEMDMLPTVAGLAAPGYTDTTLGRDLLDTRYDDKRYAFTIIHYQVPELTLIGKDYLMRIRADDSQVHLYDISGDNYQQDVSDQHPEITKKMLRLTHGIYETSKYIRFHNPNELVKHTARQ